MASVLTSSLSPPFAPPRPDPAELAWQVLDVSRSIFERDDTIEMYEEMGRSADRALMLSDAYANLGEAPHPPSPADDLQLEARDVSR